MNVNPNTVLYCLVSAFVLAGGTAFGQFYNNGSRITVGNNAVVYIKGMDLINIDSAIYNSGTITVEGNCVIGNKPTSKIITTNGDSLIVFKDFTDSSTVGQNSGFLVLKGGNQLIYSKSQRLSSLAIDGVGDKTLASNLYISANLNLKNGYIQVGSGRTFVMDSTATLSPATVTASSFVVGTMYRKRKLGAEDSLFFPIGNSKTEFRPVALVGIATPTAKYPVFGIKTALSTPQAGFEVPTVYSRVWSLTNLSKASVQSIRLYYQASDVAASPAANLVVAQSTTANGNYNSIGAKVATASYVESEFKPTQAFYTLGSSSNLKGNFKVLLEGPYSGSGMSTALSAKGVLNDTLLNTYPMASGYSVPTNVVDRITFVLVDSITGTSVDTANAWLLSDGHIRDYMTCTKNYVTFAKASPASQYFVYVLHRNHLPASSKSLVLTAAKPSSTAYNHDYSKGVYGGGAMYSLASNAWLLYASDPYKSWKNQTDVVDLARTWADEDAGIYRITGKNYRYTDLNLDGSVNSSDQSIASDHNGKLYYSTLPK